MVLAMRRRHPDIELGLASGRLVGRALVKNIKPQNILRYPEKSFTVDQVLYERLRPFFKRVVIVLDSERFELSADEFDRLRLKYDYGNGVGYRVALKYWNKITEQRRMEI